MIYYYSAEGNSRHIATMLAELTDERLADIRTCSHEMTRCPSESIGLVFPVHCWGVPPVMLEFIKRLRATGDNPYVWAVMTCGDDAGVADRMLRRCLRQSGLNLSAVFTVIMPNTYLLMKGFKLDSPETVDEKLKRADEAVRNIAFSIQRREDKTDIYRGSFPWFKTNVIYPFFFRRHIKKDRWRVDLSKCLRCGLCSRNCSVANIAESHSNTPVWSNHCVQCMACYHNCPARAIDCMPYTLGCGQYAYKG